MMGTATKQQRSAYRNLAATHTPGRPILRNVVKAFLVGGCICLVGQAVQLFFTGVFHFSATDAGNPTVAVLIFGSALCTALGVYDRFGQWAGAGSAVPVTGFANSMAAAAMEHRSEGWITGVGGNMFKLAGSVVVFGVVAAFFVALCRYLFTHL